MVSEVLAKRILFRNISNAVWVIVAFYCVVYFLIGAHLSLSVMLLGACVFAPLTHALMRFGYLQPAKIFLWCVATFTFLARAQDFET